MIVVEGLDGRHRARPAPASARSVAPLRHRADRGPARAAVAARPAPICCFDGDCAGQKAAVRAALRALPHLGPERTLRFVALPAGQDPDDVVTLRRRARRSRRCSPQPEPLVERLWRHEVEAAPLDTPEARAGLKQRLIDHASAIGDPNVRQLYRDEWLRRFDALVRPQRSTAAAAAPLYTAPRVEEARTAASSPRPRRRSAAARAIGKAGSSRRSPAPCVLGFMPLPRGARATMSRSWPHLPIADQASASAARPAGPDRHVRPAP